MNRVVGIPELVDTMRHAHSSEREDDEVMG